MRAVSIHLRDCAECRAIEASIPNAKSIWPLISVAAGTMIVAVMWYARPQPEATSHPMIRIRNPRVRVIEARLSGFAWAPYRASSTKDRPGLATLEIKAAAASVIELRRGDSSADGQHMTAVAYLLGGEPDQAARALSSTATVARNARVWSDLAAAHYAAAVHEEDAGRLGQALVAADSALRADPRLPEARFNRALIIERLGLRDLARESWEQYLEVDGVTPWAAEARAHVAALVPEKNFEKELDRVCAPSPLDSDAVRSLARRFPLEARTWGETRILGWWAVAEQAGDLTSAQNHLAIARELGSELARNHGDRMLASAVVAIERSGREARESLAAGHILFRDAQLLYKGGRASAAHPLFIKATAAFEQGGSPIALLARSFAASTAYDAGHVAEARAELERLAADAPADFPAHLAQVRWTLGRLYAMQGRLGAGIDTLNASIAGFEKLGELYYAATVREIVAEIRDLTGDSSGAWRDRALALNELGSRMTRQLQVAMTSMTRVAVMNEDWAAAASFVGLELEAIKYGGTPSRKVEILLLHAQVQNRVGNFREARQNFEDARSVIEGLDDPATATYLESEATSVEAMLESPSRAVQLLTPAIEAAVRRGRRIDLPTFLLQRGRAYLALNDEDRAAVDFEAGIAELESNRESLPEGESRWGAFDPSRELFEEAISLATARHDGVQGFEYSERFRARQLLDTLGSRWTAMTPADVPADTILVEYVALQKRLIIFVCDAAGVRAIEQPVDRNVLRENVERFANAIAHRDESHARLSGAMLHRWLIEPIAPVLARQLILIPDNTLSSVSFAALSSGRDKPYLTEKTIVFVDPSAAVFTRLRGSVLSASVVPRVLLVANPKTDSDDFPALPAAENEVARIGKLYGEDRRLVGAAATIQAFEKEAADATIIHYAGHAVAGADRGTALLFTPANGSDGRFDTKSVAAMHIQSGATVVLAACATARGEVRGAEGTISLARAFVAAGARNVIATLRPVNDEDAAEFFTRLHHYLARGIAPAEALRAVQIEWIHRSDTRLATWASVQLIGS